MQALLDTITKYWDAYCNYVANNWQSLKHYLFDLPILIFEKVFDVIIWLFQWASDSCSYCLSGAGSLASTLQSGFNSLTQGPIASAILYCLQRAEVQNCFKILTCGVIVWSVFKIIGFIKAIL